MIHYSCDSCGCHLGDERFSVSIEVRAEHDPNEITEADLDVDHLAEIAAELNSTLNTSGKTVGAAVPRRQKMSFDLCMNCREAFVSDPVGRDGRNRFYFSQN